MAPAGFRTHRHASREILQNMIISYITYITSHLGHTTSHVLQKQVRCLYLIVCKFYVDSMVCIRTILTYAQKPQR